MYKTYCLIFVFGKLIHGIPLENSSVDMERFFTPHIVGGEVAPIAYAPHMAALVIGNDFKMFICGGSIVSSSLILSAAHCIDMFIVWGELLPSFHAIVGTNNWNSGGLKLQFQGFHVHPGWDFSIVANDIGFLVLDETLKMTDRVGVIGLNFNWVGADETSYVTGWGRLSGYGIIPYYLQVLYVKTISPQECIDRVHETAVQLGTWAPPVKSDHEICTFHSYGHGMCNGDSGSALVSTNSGEQIGIVSWGFPCAIGAPDVFVRISGFKSYIESIMNKYGSK